MISRLRHAQVIHMLDTSGTLSESPKAQREPLQRLARVVAFVIGISLCLIGEPASSGSIDAIDPKTYIKMNYDKKQSNCLIKLYSKENRQWDTKAIGNEDGLHKAYGIPQLKSEYIKDLSAVEQINAGMRYIKHRYAGLPCLAWAHSKRVGWY